MSQVQRERAVSAWAQLQRRCVRLGRSGPVPHEPGRRRAVDLWPLSQLMHAGALVAGATGDPGPTVGLRTMLDRHRRGDAYAAAVHGRELYYDDNAWVGLAALELAGADPDGADRGWLDLARGLLPFLRRGFVEAGDDGTGVRWRQGDPSVNSCATGPVGLLAVRLSRHEPDPGRRDELIDVGRRTRTFLSSRLTRDDGLVGDRIRADGSLEPTVWSYNAGAAIGLDVELSLLGDTERLDDARTLAARTLEHLDVDDGLWRQPPAFNGVFLRELLVLHEHDGDTRWTTVVDHYLDRVWLTGRDPATGLVGAGGIGRYDDGVLLDHAAMVQLWALRAGRVGAEGLEPPATSL